ncbi:MAG TPA: hypothetical protein VFR84_16680 [Candidatus Angelobacter sp.]|nr:hypothetical protein [Candidatus Angelobacter sp.]
MTVRKQKRAAVRVDAALFVVALLWLLTSLLVLVLYPPGAAHAQHPGHHAPEHMVRYISPSLQPRL